MTLDQLITNWKEAWEKTPTEAERTKLTHTFMETIKAADWFGIGPVEVLRRIDEVVKAADEAAEDAAIVESGILPKLLAEAETTEASDDWEAVMDRIFEERSDTWKELADL